MLKIEFQSTLLVHNELKINPRSCLKSWPISHAPRIKNAGRGDRYVSQKKLSVNIITPNFGVITFTLNDNSVFLK